VEEDDPAERPACVEPLRRNPVTLHVAQIGFHIDPQGREPARLMEDWPTLIDVAEAAERAGTRVSVVQACSRTETLHRNGVSYHFFAADPRALTAACASGFGPLIRSLKADVFHVHGLCFPADAQILADIAPGVPILLQDHASRPPPIWRQWRRRAWRRGFAVASAISFCATEQSQPFAAAGLLGERTEIYEIPESSSRFTPGDQMEARERTHLTGDPCLLWVGHLDTNKDPLTVLAGISAAARELPRLRLYCCFANAPLLGAVQRRIATDAQLRDRVHLLGRLPHQRIELLMRAADIFVLGSHREGSGYSLIEALACGLPPVVTDIPSFRSLTGTGSVGKLWPCDDPRALCQALLSISRSANSQMRATVRAHFEHGLSFRALGVKLMTVYADVLMRKRSSWTATQQQEVNKAILSSETRL
jgi:glycosyltransferase involved in cell wall biosynthesis